MRHLPALVAALLLPAAPPLLLGTAVTTGALLVSQAPAQAQSAEAVAKVAQAITVRIEGATQGSGVLVKRDGSRYTVLTAWHVVSGQRPGEEVDIYTPDSQRHQLEQGSIRRLGEVDLAVLTFSSSNSYVVAPVADVKSVNSGSSIYVSGFPLPTSAVQSRIWRFLKGDVIANATVAISNGYQLLYSNPTLPGMSGGAVLNSQGQLVGIHGQGETDSKMSEQEGVAVKTGTNQAVPITYYSLYSTGADVVAATSQAVTADDYLAQATLILSKELLTRSRESAGDYLRVIELTSNVLRLKPNNYAAYALRARARVGIGQDKEGIEDATKALAINPASWNALFARANAKKYFGDKRGAIADYSQAIDIYPVFAAAYYNRGNAKLALGDKKGAIADYDQCITVNPQFALAWQARGNAKLALGDLQGAISDHTHAIDINLQLAEAWGSRGLIKSYLGDKQGAISDHTHAIDINPQLAEAWGSRGLIKSYLGDKSSACDDIRRSASLGLSSALRLIPQVCQ